MNAVNFMSNSHFLLTNVFLSYIFHDSWFIVMNKDKHLLCKKTTSPSLTNIEFKQQHVSKVSYENLPFVLSLIFSVRDSERLFESIIFGLRYRKMMV